MRIGKLRKRITIEQRGSGQNTAGQPATGWTAAFTAWGLIEPLSGREMAVALAAQSEVTHRVTLRYRAGVSLTSAMRVNYAGRYFNIRAIRDNQEEHRVWILDCTESADQGGM
jgi:SPP1 family predicted phage head-tail adaptor